MKNLSLVLNIILLVAVGFLYKKVYSEKTEPVMAEIPKQAKAASIVYVNTDSLLDHYDLYQDIKKRVEHMRDSADRVLENKGKALQQEYNDYQSRGAGMSESERAKTEEMIMRKQKELRDENEDAVAFLRKEEDKLNDQFHDHLTGYLKKYNKDKNYEFIFSYQRGTGILLAHDSLDITKQVLEGINKTEK